MFDFKDFQPDAVILGAGDFPENSVPLSVLRHAPFLCCCDGAAAFLINKGIMPQAIVGDGDSLSADFKNKYHDILHTVTEQDDNDLTKATRFCIAKGYSKIAYIGATGKREDHTVGNISLMARYLKEFNILPVMFTDYGVFIPCQGSVSIKTFARKQVSLFNMTCQNLTSAGLKWPARATQEWWQGTLNEATSDGITLNGDGVYLVYLTYEPKLTVPDTKLS